MKVSNNFNLTANLNQKKIGEILSTPILIIATSKKQNYLRVLNL
jgi:hypothetical protein